MRRYSAYTLREIYFFSISAFPLFLISKTGEKVFFQVWNSISEVHTGIEKYKRVVKKSFIAKSRKSFCML